MYFSFLLPTKIVLIVWAIHLIWRPDLLPHKLKCIYTRYLICRMTYYIRIWNQSSVPQKNKNIFHYFNNMRVISSLLPKKVYTNYTSLKKGKGLDKKNSALVLDR